MLFGPKEQQCLTLTPARSIKCPWFCSQVFCSAYLLSPELRVLSLISFIRLIKCNQVALCSAARHLGTPQPRSQHGGTLAGLIWGSPVSSVGAPRWQMALEKGAHGCETLSPFCMTRCGGLSVVFRRPRSRPPTLLPCGAVSPSTSPAAGGFSRRPWLPEATPVSRCCSSCRQRRKSNQTSEPIDLSGYVKATPTAGWIRPVTHSLSNRRALRRTHFRVVLADWSLCLQLLMCQKVQTHGAANFWAGLRHDGTWERLFYPQSSGGKWCSSL